MVDRLGKTDAQIAREREEAEKRTNECKGCYWEAHLAGSAPQCRRGYPYGNRCREFKQT